MAGCRPLTQEEVTLVLSKLENKRDKALFILGLATGYRVSELLSLRFQDVWANGKPLAAAKVAAAHMKKAFKCKAESREVPLNADAVSVIADLEPAAHKPTDFLFPSRQGKGQALSRFMAHLILKKAYAAAGLTGTLATHSLRKSFADDIYKSSGNDIMATMQALGHKQVTSTQSYVPANRELVNKLIRNRKLLA